MNRRRRLRQAELPQPILPGPPTGIATSTIDLPALIEAGSAVTDAGGAIFSTDPAGNIIVAAPQLETIAPTIGDDPVVPVYEGSDVSFEPKLSIAAGSAAYGGVTTANTTKTAAAKPVVGYGGGKTAGQVARNST